MMSHLDSVEKREIGWAEYVDLPDWHIRQLRAKIDTGAETSAIHVEDVERLPRGRVRFCVVLSRKDHQRRVHVTAKITRRTRVRSSTGHYSLRYFVSTRIRIGPVEKTIEVSLISREHMTFRMLIGRSALERNFLVNPGKRYHLTKKIK